MLYLLYSNNNYDMYCCIAIHAEILFILNVLIVVQQFKQFKLIVLLVKQHKYCQAKWLADKTDIINKHSADIDTHNIIKIIAAVIKDSFVLL